MHRMGRASWAVVEAVGTAAHWYGRATRCKRQRPWTVCMACWSTYYEGDCPVCPT